MQQHVVKIIVASCFIGRYSLCLNCFSPTCPKVKFRKNLYAFKQILKGMMIFVMRGQ